MYVNYFLCTPPDEFRRLRTKRRANFCVIKLFLKMSSVFHSFTIVLNSENMTINVKKFN